MRRPRFTLISHTCPKPKGLGPTLDELQVLLKRIARNEYSPRSGQKSFLRTDEVVTAMFFFSQKTLKKKGGNQCLYFPQTFFRIKVTGFGFRLGLALGLGLGKLEVRVKVTSREGIGELGLWYPNMYIDRGVHSVSSRWAPVYVQ